MLKLIRSVQKVEHLYYKIFFGLVIISIPILSEWLSGGGFKFHAIMVSFLVMAVGLFGIILDTCHVQKEKSLQKNLRLSEQRAQLGILASSIGHELNNTLTSIFGFLELVNDSPDDSKLLKTALGVLKNESERIKGYAGNLLYLGRPHEVKPENVNLNHFLDTTIERLNTMGATKHYTIQKKYTEPLPLVMIDPFQLEQVIQNMTLNAVHALSHDGTLLFETGIKKKNVFFSLRDNGCGIPEENLKKIFEPFFTTREGKGGTGLGMSVIRDIVEENHGCISIQSEVDKGTTVEIQFPPV